MDLFFELSEDIRRKLFHISEEKEHELRHLVETTKDLDYDQVAEIAQQQLPKFVGYKKINNPYKRWRRRGHQKMFQWGNWKRSIPEGMIKDKYKDVNTAYVVDGYSALGSYAQVHTFVVFHGKRCVVKMMEADDADFFELVTQVYLFQECSKLYSHISVPEIFFIQRGKDTHSTDVCMARGNGSFLAELDGDNLLVALAHVLRSLWFLQKDLFFMHRDLSGTNVMVDFNTFNTTFIDFGMACVNPKLNEHSWQRYNESFYIPEENSHATKCTNRSHDVCTLVAWLSVRHPFLQLEHHQMKRRLREIVNASPNERAKSPLRSPKQSPTQFTSIKPGWSVGNELNTSTHSPDGRHWWVFNMVEFPMEEWYPENMMTRLLAEIPFEHWFGIRRRWSTLDDLVDDPENKLENPFDAYMPKLKVYLDDGREGVVQKLNGNKLQIQIGTEIVDILPGECSTVDL